MMFSKEVVFVRFFLFAIVPLLLCPAHAQEFLTCQSNNSAASYQERFADLTASVLKDLGGDDLSARFGVVPTIEIRTSSKPNAYAVGHSRILLTSALLERVQQIDELAFVLAHELGHLVDSRNGHHKALPEAFIPTNHTPQDTYWEARADAFAMKLLQESGFSAQSGLQFLRRIAFHSGNQYSALSSIEARIALLGSLLHSTLPRHLSNYLE